MQKTDKADNRRDNGPGWHTTHVGKDGFLNPKFEAYYRGTVVPEAEWEPFVEALRTPLPVSFRLSTISGLHEKILNTLQGSCFGLPKEPVIHEIDGEKFEVQAPAVLPWYSPVGHGYQVKLSKKCLKRVPALSTFREFLIREDKQGNITRQEAVSMIPPQLLGVEPHHIVLDMCAAPGSKTAQLLEALHADGPNTVPTGLVIANDADHKRAYMLVHQLKRLGSPAFLVSTHQGQFYPNLYIPVTSPHASNDLAYLAANSSAPAKKSDISPVSLDNTSLNTPDVGSAVKVAPLLFDRILCDVPCSGDGTLRKCPAIWRTWSIGGGMGLHPLQLAIAWRSAQMLKVGGQMVYSTCSLNPIENEAVVAELIRRSRGALRLVDVSSKLPGLVREDGMHSWDVLIEHNPKAEEKTEESSPASAEDKKLKLFNLKAVQDVNSLPFLKRRRLRTSFFAPDTLANMKAELDAGIDTADDVEAEKEDKENKEKDGKKKAAKADDYFSKHSSVFNHLPTAEEMHLERCVRILPHKQDTGGFFITLIEKVDVLPNWDGFFSATDKVEKKVETSEKVDDKSMTDTTEVTAVTEESVTPVVAEKKTYPHGFTKKLEFKDKPKEKQWNDFPFVNLQSRFCELLQKEFGLDVSKGYQPRNLFNRSDNLAGNGKKIYFLSDTISDIVNTPHNFRLKIVHSGLKIFEVTANAASKASKRGYSETTSSAPVAVVEEENPSYRLAQDALNFVAPFLTKQILNVKVADLLTLLRANNTGVKHIDFTDETREILEFVPEFATEEAKAARVAENKCIISLGSCVVRVLAEDLPEDIAQISNQLMCAAWRSHATLSLMLAEPERASLLNLLDPKVAAEMTESENADL